MESRRVFFAALVAFMTPGFIHRDGKPIVGGQGWRLILDEDSTKRRDEFK